MKTYHVYFTALALCFLFAGCSEDDVIKRPSANVGDEVKFGLSLPGLSTRTIYGEETATGFPIYWVNGDLVKVASPQCLSGRNSAEYEIAVDGATQNYATSMTKTGEYGVQWGNSETADFYSIYPSTSGTELTVTDESVSAKLQVAATQYASITEKDTSYYAQPANMGNVVMYAVTKDVLNTAGAVELRYKPFSTVIEFEITAPKTSDASHQSEITIQSLSLIAPTNTNIAGDFKFNFPATSEAAPSIESIGTGSNAITLHFLDNNQYKTTLSTTNIDNAKQTLKAKMCLMPISEVPKDGWTVALNTSAGTFVKNITLDNLTAGLVHKIKLPKLNYSSKEWEYNPASWIPSLPDYTNIYLTEISLPGAWYAGGKIYTGTNASQNYQVTDQIEPLWKAGIRAFAVECRSFTADRVLFGDNNNNPSGLCVSGTGYENGGAYCNQTSSGYGGKVTRIKDVISDVATCVNANKNEYAVLVLSYADGGSGGHRDKDHEYFIKGVADEITASSATNIYDGEITKNTIVNSVKGNVIIVVDVDDNITKGSYEDNGKFLMNYTPFPTKLPTVKDVYYSNLYWQSWADTNKKLVKLNSNDFLWCFSSANRTDCTNSDDETGEITNSNGVATLSQRKYALMTMGNKSKDIYGVSSHNVWFYYNCGGGHSTATSGDTDAAAFAKAMNPWLLNRIKIKLGEVANSDGNKVPEPSPLGIVMFNRCTDTATDTYHGPEIIDAIIRMNSKFYLKHAGANTDSSTGDITEETAEVTSLSLRHDSGMKDTGDNAIHW